MVAARRRYMPGDVATINHMTQELFRQDAYLRECDAHITAMTDTGGIVLDRTVFYPLGGGQAGDSGVLVLADGSSVASTESGRCGPCCSMAATGRTATVCAAWPLACRRAKSRVVRSAQ